MAVAIMVYIGTWTERLCATKIPYRFTLGGFVPTVLLTRHIGPALGLRLNWKSIDRSVSSS
jgi:hypothetical protein